MLTSWAKALPLPCPASKTNKQNEATVFIFYREKQKQVWDLKLVTLTCIVYLARASSVDWPFPEKLGNITDDIILATIHLRKFNLTVAEFCSLTIPTTTDLKLSKISGKSS